jgi:hypothetical protein
VFFTVEPAGTATSHVTIATDVTQRGGLQGIVERLLVSLMMPRIYRKEVERLATYAAGLRESPAAGSLSR